MDTFNKNEYLDLITALLEQQYGDDLDPIDYLEEDQMLSKSYIKKIAPATNDKVINLTNIKKDKIKDFLHQYRNIKVGNFSVKISKYSSVHGGSGSNLVNMDIVIYEDNSKSKMGNRDIIRKIDVIKDSRFNQCGWLKHFNQFKIGRNISMDTMADVIRWLQTLERMTAFI
jgi:hypothetical protein